MGLFFADLLAIKMLMPKKNLVSIYEHLFKEGVMVAKKDHHAPKHPELETVPNLQVIKALNSLKSRGYVKEQFAWRHYYWYLTNEGIGYLRNYLHLPPEIVPTTLKRQSRPDARPRPSAAAGGRSFGDKPADVIARLTGEHLAPTAIRLELLDLVLPPWNSEEDLVEARR